MSDTGGKAYAKVAKEDAMERESMEVSGLDASVSDSAPFIGGEKPSDGQAVRNHTLLRSLAAVVWCASSQYERDRRAEGLSSPAPCRAVAVR